VKTAQGKYAQVVLDEMQDVLVRWFESCGLGVGQNLLTKTPGAMQPNEPKSVLGERGRIRTCATHALKEQQSKAAAHIQQLRAVLSPANREKGPMVGS
jgi:hypothetical protein